MQFLLETLTFSHRRLLLSHHLGHTHCRCRLDGQRAQQYAIISRVLLLAQARPQHQQPDQLALTDQRHCYLHPLRLQSLECRRIQLQFINLHGPRGTQEMGHNGILRRDIECRYF